MPRPTIHLSHTPAGVAVLAVAIFATLFGAFRLAPEWIAPGLVGIAVWLTLRALAKRQPASVTIARQLPNRAWAGESFAIESILTNHSKTLSLPDLAWRDPLSPTLRRFRRVSPGELRKVTYPGRWPRRGIYRSGSWTGRSHWPMGLFEVECAAPFEGAGTMLLLPSPFVPNSLRLHLDTLETESDDMQRNAIDPSAEFRLLREFRHGDPVRAIHWPSSLRTDQLQVRETDPPGHRPFLYGLALHSFSPAGRIVTPETYELVLRIVMGLLIRFRDREISLLYFPGSGETVLLDSRDAYHREIDRLATIARAPLSSLDPVIALEAQLAGCDEVFVVSDCPRPDWQEEIQPLFDRCTCIDATSVATASRPSLRLRKRLVS